MPTAIQVQQQQIVDAVATCKRLGVKPPKALLRQFSNLHHYTQWQRKAKLAATKLKIYRRKINAYERREKRRGK